MKPAELAVGTQCVVTVPASTSNLGPGFDALGCAVSLANRFTFRVESDPKAVEVQLSGPRCAGIPPTPRNLALTTASNFMRRRGFEAPPLSLVAEIHVPSARGLGSSSTAIVAGLLAGNALLDSPLDREQLLTLAVEIEGHPDNVAPAILGGFIISASDSKPLCYRKRQIHPNFRLLFLVPDYEVRTSDARNALPRAIPLADGIFNASRSPLLVMALLEGDPALLTEAMEDRFHQPHRKHLFRHYEELRASALEAGAAGFCVSGAGPTLLAVATEETKEAVRAGLLDCMKGLDLGGEILELAPDAEGSRVALIHP